MVAISIMALVSAVILTRQSAFDNAVLLRNQAYEVALQIRSLQFSAVSASGESNNFTAIVGAYFNTGTAGSFTMYRDVAADGFDGVDSIGTVKLDQRFEIADIKVGGTSETKVAVAFQRPNFDAVFYEDATLASEYPESVVRIEIVRKGGTSKYGVDITKTGQISVVKL